MKAINIKTGSISQASKIKQSFDSIYMHPCYYAEIIKDGKRRDWIWKVGCKRENESSDEFSFKMCRLGNIDDNEVWDRITGLDFAVMLIELYKNGGEASVKHWLKNNCADK